MPEKYIVFDLETSDLYHDKLAPTHKDQAWPVEFGAAFLDESLNITRKFGFILKPPFDGATISKGAFDTHHISIERCVAEGVPQGAIRTLMLPVFKKEMELIGHNTAFDTKFLFRYARTMEECSNLIEAQKNAICTMRRSTEFCKLPPTKNMARYKGLKYKPPKLEELHQVLFGIPFEGAHGALTDVLATHRCFVELVKLGVITLDKEE